MAENDLKDFLREQAKSLDSLLALTPAKMMFGEDVSDQWKRKKQTPEQKRAARLAKLDPANWKSAKDVYDEREAEALKKRKREAGQANDAQVEQDRTESDRPPVQKKLKTDITDKKASLGRITEKQDGEGIQNENFRKRAKKRANKLKKNEEMKQKKQDKKAQKVAESAEPSASGGAKSIQKSHGERGISQEKNVEQRPKKQRTEQRLEKDKDMMEVDDFSALAEIEESPLTPTDDEVDREERLQKSEAIPMAVDEEDDDSEYSTIASSEESAEIFSPPQDSAASSVSSAQAPTSQSQKAVQSAALQSLTSQSDTGRQTSSINESKYDKQAARDRLQQALSGFRAQRKADDKAPRSRAELLAQRKRQEDERKAVKKEQKRKEKEEEARRQEEEMVRRFSPGGSGSLLGSPRSPMVEGGGNAFSFGRIAFEDGTQLDSTDLTATVERKRKGPQDAKTALQAAEAKHARISGYDEDKRKMIESKETWSNMNKRASGEKTKDNTSLLKKALKRQDKQKLKSSKEWNERKEGVQSSIDARQKKRTENIQARKDAKFAKKAGTKVKKRAGFEGSFRGRTGKTKK